MNIDMSAFSKSDISVHGDYVTVHGDSRSYKRYIFALIQCKPPMNTDMSVSVIVPEEIL